MGAPRRLLVSAGTVGILVLAPGLLGACGGDPEPATEPPAGTATDEPATDDPAAADTTLAPPGVVTVPGGGRSPVARDADTPSGIDPCALLDADLIAVELAGTVGDPQAVPSGVLGAATCTWVVERPDASGVELRLAVTADDAIVAAGEPGGVRALVAGVLADLPDALLLPGLADTAFLHPSGMHLQVADVYVIVSLGPDSLDDTAALTDLGIAVRDRLLSG